MLALLLFLDCSWGPSGLVQDQGRSTGGVACIPGGREAPASRHLFQKDRMASGWIEDVLARKSVLGRDMRAALDRQDKPGELHGIAPGGSAHP